MPEADGPAEPPSIDDTLEYIADMLFQLEEMARRNELGTLARILDLARGEVRQQAKRAR